jgi:hypothetical protein
MFICLLINNQGWQSRSPLLLNNKMGNCLPSILDGLLVVGLAPPGCLLHVNHEEGVAPGGRGKTQFILTLIPHWPLPAVRDLTHFYSSEGSPALAVFWPYYL